MLVYQFDKKWQEDIDIIMTGKFSKVSEEYKSLMPVTIKSKDGSNKERLTMQHSIFNKSESLKKYWFELYGLEFAEEDEVWEFYPTREVFTQKTLDSLI